MNQCAKNNYFPLSVYLRSYSKSRAMTRLNLNKTCSSENERYDFSEDFPSDLRSRFQNYFEVRGCFISLSEEECLLKEVEPVLKRMRYEFDHWDNAIQGFREIERLKWNDLNTKILTRIRNYVFRDSPSISLVHVLDLSDQGHIKPHIDSVRFCGDIIAGLNLLTNAVMRLVKDNSYYCDVLLKRRDMYIMRGPARYEFTHEILPLEKSIFRGSQIEKKRRLSLILRSDLTNG